jgi:hypothetical protein
MVLISRSQEAFAADALTDVFRIFRPIAFLAESKPAGQMLSRSWIRMCITSFPYDREVSGPEAREVSRFKAAGTLANDSHRHSMSSSRNLPSTGTKRLQY